MDSSAHFVFAEQGGVIFFQRFKYMRNDGFAVPPRFVFNLVFGQVAFYRFMLVVVKHKGDFMYPRLTRGGGCVFPVFLHMLQM